MPINNINIYQFDVLIAKLIRAASTQNFSHLRQNIVVNLAPILVINCKPL
uniref:Uncharacterized protein n=1 Tax=Rheinheimera sp. BAL341 TaxID=1708203 RepID=A0A486XJ43_9GAMM